MRGMPKTLAFQLFGHCHYFLSFFLSFTMLKDVYFDFRCKNNDIMARAVFK
jgi:hypothetical protein